MANPNTNATRLRVYFAEDDTYKGRHLHEVLIEHAMRLKLAGATLQRAVAGFGAKSVLHTSRILNLAESLPLVLEIIDAEERITAFMPFVEEVLEEGLVTLDAVEIRLYRHRDTKDGA